MFGPTHTFYNVQCIKCHTTLTSPDSTLLKDQMKEHESVHVVRKANAKRIVDQVYKPDAFIINEAIEQAEAAGFRYLLWNDAVYYTTSVDWNNPLCLLSDLEETKVTE